MKKINIIKSLGLSLFILFFVNASFSTKSNAIASCCSSEKGRCTGSANCTACSNCSRCGYCNSGGSCGVCAGYKKSSSKTYDYQPKNNYPTTTYPSSSNTYNLPDDKYSKYYLETLIVVNTDALNLRKGPSSSYEVIQSLKKNQELIFLAMTGEWVKVKVKSNGNIGFVHSSYIVVAN